MELAVSLNFRDPSKLKHEFSTGGYAELDSPWLTRFNESSDLVSSARIWLEGTRSRDLDSFRHSVMNTINRIDELLESQLNEILHHPEFQQLERGGWVGVRYLCEQVDSRSSDSVKVKVLTATWNEISKDALKAIEFDQSALFKLLYQMNMGWQGGENLWCGGWRLSASL